MANNIPSFLLDPLRPASSVESKGKVKMPFIEKGINHLAKMIKRGYVFRELSSPDGFFQRMDARVKVLFLLFFVVIISLKRDFLSELYIWVFIFVLALFSRLNILTFYRRVLFFGFVFGFLIALPSAFNVITEGEMVLPLLKFSKPHHFWIYHIPADIGITKEGIYGVLRLTMRVIDSLSVSFLVLYTTPFPEMMKALKVLRIPDSFLIIITLSYKYIFLFSRSVEDIYLAKKSRMIREERGNETREWIVGRLAFVFKKTQLRCEEVFKAMIGRGYSDSIRLYGFRKMGAADWLSGALLFSAGVLFLLIF
jgi:cobalt/nickel transport system permease protein